MEQKLNLKTKLDLSKPTRVFLYDFWSALIDWYLDNSEKNLFLEMFNSSVIIRNCTEDETRYLFRFIEDRIEEALSYEEIVTHDLDCFLLNLLNFTRAIVVYLQMYPEFRTAKFLKEQFNRYWRSAANF